MTRLFRFLVISASIVLSFSLACWPQQFNPNAYAGIEWRSIGPFRGGRTVAVTGVPGKPTIFYMAAVNGGVWKSTDYGQVWSPIFDGQPSGSVGAIAVAPSDPNIIYVGSGEGLQRPDLATGDGIYKSRDGGITWQHLGLRDGRQIGAIVVDPRDANRLFIAVLGHPYGPNPERGVFRSTDGGQSWQKVLYKDENTGAIALAFDPSNAQIIYADLWVARRPPWTTGNPINGPGSGLYKSLDGGSTWRQLTIGLPTSAQGLGRIGIGIAPSDPNRICALVDAKQGGGLYRSDDAGNSWQRVNHENRIWGRGSDFAGVIVAPDNKDTIYVANTSAYRSTNAGQNFTAIKGAPGGDDYHTVWINPENPQIILLGSDQGATISVNGGETWSSWYNQPTAQFYHVITDNRFPYWVYGGQQESGSIGIASRSDYGEITFRDWHTVGTEEYGYVAPDPLDPNIIYGGKVTRYNQTTGQAEDISPVVLRTGRYRFNRTAPLVFSPADPHALYLGSNVLFKTVDGGRTWRSVSPDLTRENPGVPENLGIFTSIVFGTPHRGVIYTVAPSPKDANLIWAGTDDGLIHVTSDGGQNWQDVTPPELTPWSKLAMIEASHYDPQTAYAAVNRFRLDDLRPYIYATHDGGKSWQRTTNGLSDDAPVNVVREDPVRQGLLFAGTEKAIYVSFNDGGQWQSLQLNLPATSMRDLVVHGDDLVVGTHGRSFWILDDLTPLRQLNQQTIDSAAYLFRPQQSYRVRRSVNTDTPLPPEFPAGKNPPAGAILDYYLHDGSSGPVTLEVLDQAGNVVRRFSSDDKPEPLNEKEINVPTYWLRPPQILSAQPGMHRFVWDLHYTAPAALAPDYPISAIYRDTPRNPQGPRAVPGTYTVRLGAGGRYSTQPLTLEMDPRVKVTREALAQQFEMEKRLTEAMSKNYEVVHELRALREQLKALQARSGAGELKSSITQLDGQAAALEGDEGDFGATIFNGLGGNSLMRLNVGLTRLLDTVDGADAAPTAEDVASINALEGALKSQWARWEQMKQRDLPALNRQLQAAGLSAISLSPATGQR